MLYHLFNYLHEEFALPGAGVFQYISFRAAAALVLSLAIFMIFGKRMIGVIAKKQIGETVRNLGLEGEKQKAGTPTMGGLLIIAAILIPVLLFCRMDNVYVWLMTLTTVWLGIMGFMDDYIKVFKHDKEGMKGWFKVIGQVGLGLIIGLVMCFHPDITQGGDITTNIPFVKNNELNYTAIMEWMHSGWGRYTWILFVLVVIFVVTAVSNGCNLTDGIDGLASGSSAIVGATLAILCWITGNVVAADYLNIMYIPNAGELTVFMAAFTGATVGFLWYNANPAQIFMGDTGSLTLGGIIAVAALLARKELLLPVLCGIFLVESVSDIMQVFWFKYTKKKYGQGRRIFLMAPLHHHFQKKGQKEAKIVMRFFIVGVMLAVITLVTLKLR